MPIAIIPGGGGGGGGGSGTVTNVSSPDTSIVVTNPTTTPSLQVATLDVLAVNRPPAANWSNNAKKITGLANGSAATDAAAFGQIPAVPVASVFGRTGAVVAVDADYSGIVATHLTGAVAATRYVGGTASGAPASGTFAVGDFVVDQRGLLWVCTVAGTPGTWISVGTGKNGCRVYNSTDQTITNNAFGTLAFDSERFDYGAMHDPVTNNSRITAAVKGIYNIGTVIRWNADAAGVRELHITLNGTVDIGFQKTNASITGGTIMSATAAWEMAVNDYVEIRVYLDNATGNLAVTSTGDISPEAWAVLMAAT